MSRARALLAVNAGSTSIKVSALDGDQVVARYDSLDEALADDRPLDAVAHRVVHGGERTAPVVLDDDSLGELRGLEDLAPLHQPPALDAIDRCRAARPDVAQVACFDTAFHATIPVAARTYALPARLRQLGVRVFGFHGLSHAWSAGRLGAWAPEARRVVVAHLGGGASLCGLLDGASTVTTMGFTPLDGLVMATRCGSIDPGALLWLARRLGPDEDLDVVLERESGLLGLCGTGDMRSVLARADAGDDDARLALDVWVHRVVVELGGCVAALGGLDALVFTGGIGEHSAPVRRRVAERLAWLGVDVDDVDVVDEVVVGSVAVRDVEEITAPRARVRSFVVAAREDVQMAVEVGRLLDS